MNVAHRPEELEPARRAVAIGTFDGVHRGHRRVLEAACAARLRSTVVTFDPHPRTVFGSRIELLTTLERRLELLEESRVEDALVLRFDEALASLEPEVFADVVLRAIGAEVVAAGDGFRFGRRRAGDLAVLEALGFDVRRVPLVDNVSSSHVRALLTAGDVVHAAKLLGGPAEVEGYLPRGVRKSAMREAPGFVRALEMLEAKLAGRPWVSEIPYQAPEAVAPAPPIADLRRAEIALITTGGLVPKGNPDGQTSGNAQKYFRYPIDQLQALRSGEWEAYHVGYFTHLVDKNPNYVLPLGYMRALEKEGMVGAVHRYAYTLPGVSTPVATARRLGEGIAAQLREGQVGGCLLVST